MNSKSPSALHDTISRLRKSAIFQLSLSAKELFHSNFLGWLCQAYPEPMGRLLAEVIGKPPQSLDPTTVERERKNIDLSVRFKDGHKLIVENKVKSLPGINQLTEYSNQVKDEGQTHFLLLTLTRPAFLATKSAIIELENGTIWHYLSYGGLAERLWSVAKGIELSYHRELISDYIRAITDLDSLQARFASRWDDQGLDFFESQDDLAQLRKIRLHDVFDKLRYAHLEERVATRLRKLKISVSHSKLPAEEDGAVSVASTMTRGVGLFDFKYSLSGFTRKLNRVVLGIQIQGRQFRIVVEQDVNDDNRATARKIASALWKPVKGGKVWFDFRHLKGVTCSAEYPLNEDFNQYSRIFYYRYRKLEGATTKQLVDSIASYAELIRDNERRLKRQIESALGQ